MFRARLASVVMAAGLAASSGCTCFDHPWFHGSPTSRGQCPQAPCPCADSCPSTAAAPMMEGPMLQSQDAMPCAQGQLPPGAIPVMPGQMPGQLPPGAIPAMPGQQMPPGAQQRLVPTPQSMPMPYTP